MGPPITFDDSLWPLLISRFKGAVTDAQHEAFLAQSASFLQRGELYVIVTDMSQYAMPPAAHRQRQAEWLKEHEQGLCAHLLGCALVVTSPLVRLTLSAVFHLQPMPTPYVVVPDVASGVKWAADRLESAGLLQAAGRVRHHFALPSGQHSE